MAPRREKIRVFEVGPRDGLQNEAVIPTTAAKLAFVRDLIAAGVKDLELGAFVRTDRVPQMADTDRIYEAVATRKLKLGHASAWALVPNRHGLERALEAGVTQIAVFTAATESFVKRNIGMTIRESLREFDAVIREARQAVGSKLRVRGYVSTAFACPFEGITQASAALRVSRSLWDLGVDELSIGDTIGAGTPNQVDDRIAPLLKVVGQKALGVHFHDTRGTALANALRAYECGVRTFDASAGGLGGCPFAPGASGNLATEDLVYMFEQMGVDTGIDLDALCRASSRILAKIRRPGASRYLHAWRASRR